MMYADDAPKRHGDIPRIYDFFWDYQVKNGKMLCIVYVAKSAAGARACEDSTKNDPLYAFLVSVIDFDQKLVRMRFRDNSGGFRWY